MPKLSSSARTATMWYSKNQCVCATTLDTPYRNFLLPFRTGFATFIDLMRATAD